MLVHSHMYGRLTGADNAGPKGSQADGLECVSCEVKKINLLRCIGVGSYILHAMLLASRCFSGVAALVLSHVDMHDAAFTVQHPLHKKAQNPALACEGYSQYSSVSGT